MRHQDRLTTLGQLWAAWDRRGQALSAEQWERPTRLGDWTLDLQRALGVPPDLPAAGVEHTVGLLAEMAPPVDFIELATGRSSVTLFPVLR